MNTTTVTKTIDKIHTIKDAHKNNVDLIGIYVIKIEDWNISNFIPILVLTKQKLQIQIGEKYIEMNIDELENISIHDKKNNKFVIIKSDKTDFTFALVEIDENLDKVNNNFTEAFYKLLKSLKDNKVNTKILELLPDQSHSQSSNSAAMPILITSVFLIALGMVVQTITFVFAWFLVISGVIMGIIGLVLLVLKRS